ncbi:MAG TPA: ATP-binding protein [Candidatus Paceibacterota bacterium]|nr:ATP-binding protein [Verrucomicrobiota bacterium]HRY50119.1 ATP-binding protein [Candidatus Paceibacterota bacterium]
MKPRPALAEFTPPLSGSDPTRLPLRGWALELARRWNTGSYSVFILHGNIFDVFPVQEGAETAFVSLKTFLVRRLFPERAFLLFYDISDGLTFGSADMQKRFFEWLEIYDRVENTAYHVQGPPREFLKLAPLLRRFFQHMAQERQRGATLILEFPEKIVPSTSDAYASPDERIALVTLMKWAASPEMRRSDVGILLVTESAAELNSDLVQNPHIAQIKIDLPDAEERLQFLQSGNLKALGEGRPLETWCDLTESELASRLSGLNLVRVQNLLVEAIRNQIRVTVDYLAAGKKRLIEDYCQGLVRFKNPKAGVSLDAVATHVAAKKRLRELAWLIKNGKHDVLERGVLLPGRVGVGKSFLVDCFASECGLPVMEIGEFRSKWVGDTELQQARILMTIRALGPVVVVVDEADAVFGSRESGSDDSGVSGRVFAAFAAHIGDSSLRGRELWIAMTSRPDLLAIDMKRQGRFGLSIPLFPAQNAGEVMELFTTIARFKKIELSDAVKKQIKKTAGDRPFTGSDVEAILVRAKERAVLAERDDKVQAADVQEALESFVDPLDPQLLALQELAAVLACSDRRYLPARYQNAERGALVEEFNQLKHRLGFRRV